MKNLMEGRARTIRREVKSRQWKQGRCGYPRELCELVVGYAEARQRQGARSAIVREVGMAVQTIQNWLGGRARGGLHGACVVTPAPISSREVSVDNLRCHCYDVDSVMRYPERMLRLPTAPDAR
jgi:hypothetical protein